VTTTTPSVDGVAPLPRCSSNRTEADFQAWRDERDWTAEKYRRFDRGERMPPDWRASADRGWNRRFDEPIPLPRGRQLVTLMPAGT
jgi:hypothetical protein